MKIPFDQNWKNIAISVSGGADSALLAYLLCEIVKDHGITVHIINHIRMWKSKPWQQYDGEQVYNWLFQNFRHVTFVRHVNLISPDIEYGNMGPIIKDEYGKMVSGDNAQQRSYAEFICHKYNIDAYYNAVTRNPANIDLGGMAERDIDPTEDNKHLLEMIHMGRHVFHPFRFIDKSKIVKKYKELNLIELLNITRSCEGEFDGINYATYIPGQTVPTCGTCFWCKEREWAIEQNK
jgi:hypothetical protein